VVETGHQELVLTEQEVELLVVAVLGGLDELAGVLM